MLRHFQFFAKYFGILLKKKKRLRSKGIKSQPTKPLNGYLPHFKQSRCQTVLNTESDHCECN